MQVRLLTDEVPVSGVDSGRNRRALGALSPLLTLYATPVVYLYLAAALI